ncbi:hypothetical protein CASFOL_003805 [Castilleja foliolosa]|uniref:NAB domain-containing protein n=1 Tax=Castilleja foliolosa TaxID=1961234 RepID=A0ABD3EM36_9LAMI
MEEKVQGMIKLIEEDGDSFAKRAEMYYKRRPELISSVEESYRAFKALADRYDLLSKELQNANHTIATVFPEQVQFDMDEDEDCPTPKLPKKNNQIPIGNPQNIPKVPKAPIENLKGLISTASKQIQAKKTKPAPKVVNKTIVKSGLNKDEALIEIDKLHKDILSLQTVKEFVKSSYESGLAKYWEIENQIMELQDKVCRLQDEFDVESVIEDNEARTLMAEAALKSCQETLAVLQEKQEKSTREAREEFKKIESARELLSSIRHEFLKEKQSNEEQKTSDDASDVTNKIEKKMDSGSGSMGSLTVTELAEKIDELVNKVISLETAVSSQTVMIDALRNEADELHSQIKNLKDEKESLIGDTNSLSIRVKEMEEKLRRLESLNRDVENENNNLQTNFDEARLSLGHLSEKLGTVKPDEEIDETESLSEEKLEKEMIKDEKIIENVQIPVEDKTSPSPNAEPNPIPSKSPNTEPEPIPSKSPNTEPEPIPSKIPNTEPDPIPSKIKNTEPDPIPSKSPDTEPNPIPSKIQEGLEDVVKNVEIGDPNQEEVKKPVKKTVTFVEPKENLQAGQDNHSEIEPVKSEAPKQADMSWQQMLLSGTEDRETILLKEYTAILKNYKEVKKKLSDTEKKEKDVQFDITVQMRDLKQAILKRDHEIQHLKEKLTLLNGNTNDDDVKDENNDDKPEDIIIKDDDFNDISDTISPIEEKLRLEINAILDENLDFWLRFSTAFHQVQKFKSEVQDLQDEIMKLSEKKKQEGNVTAQQKSEARPIYKHLREIQTELSVWLEQSVSLKDELKRRFESLCGIQEEITKFLQEGVDDEIRFSTHQAAKLQGEILNMKQENNKVRTELQTGLDHVSVLQVETEKTLRQLNEEFGISSDQPKLQQNLSKARVPLRSFIFGTRAKKQKHSLFSFMHPNRKFHVVRAGGGVGSSDQ